MTSVTQAPLVGLATAAAGVAASGGEMVAQTVSDAAGIAPYIQGGGLAAAVGGLVYVTRKLLNGDLVSRPVAEYDKRLLDLLEASAEREKRLVSLFDAAREDHHGYRQALDAHNRLLGEVAVLLGHDRRAKKPGDATKRRGATAGGTNATRA